MKKPKSNRQIGTPTPTELLDQAVVLLLQASEMIDDLIKTPKLCYKKGCQDYVKRLRERAHYLSKFAPRR